MKWIRISALLLINSVVLSTYLTAEENEQRRHRRCSADEIQNQCEPQATIYVVNQHSNGILIFDARANSDVSPVRTITGEHTGLGVPSGVAVDAKGNLYVANFPFHFGRNAITVYAPGADGDAFPIRTITGDETKLAGPQGVAVDTDGNLYVVNDGNQSVTVYPRGADGDVAPTRTILDSRIQSPRGLAVDTDGNIYVANTGSSTITIYDPGKNGRVTPTRTIQGPQTKLQNPEGVAVDTHGNLYVETDSLVGNDPPLSAITVYPPGADGNVAPTREIFGERTGLLTSGFGVALDVRGNIYVFDNPVGSILVFGAGAEAADSNVAPIRTIHGSGDSIKNSIILGFAGIALGPPCCRCGSVRKDDEDP
jgi:hypothetical protein